MPPASSSELASASFRTLAAIGSLGLCSPWVHVYIQTPPLEMVLPANSSKLSPTSSRSLDIESTVRELPPLFEIIDSSIHLSD